MPAWGGQPWVRLDVETPTARLSPGWRDTSVHVTYSDSTGARFQASRDDTSAVLIRSQWVGWPTGASLALLAHVGSLPIARVGPYANGPAPLAVFFTVPSVPDGALWRPEPGRPVGIGRWPGLGATLLFDLLTGVGASADKVELIRLGRTPRSARSPFRLPLRIHVSGDGSERTASWLRNEPLFGVRYQEDVGLGLQVTWSEASRAGDLDGCDVLVVLDRSPELVETLLRVAGRLSPDRRPRMIVVLRADSRAPGRDDPVRLNGLPAGVAGIRVRTPDEFSGLALVTALLQGIMHDLPMHECVAAARRTHAATTTTAGDWSIDLAGTPATLDSIRMIDAYLDMQHRAYDLLVEGAVGRPPAPDGSAARVGTWAQLSGRRFQGLLDEADHAASGAARAYVSFQRESMGLWPITSNLSLLERASKGVQAAAADVIAAVRADPEAADAIGRDQERTVSVWLTHLGEDGPSAIQSSAPLHVDQVYLLNAAIGVRWPTDLVVGSVPPVDPLLPDLDGDQAHRLQFALYGIDFTPISDTVVDVDLPRLGASNLATFVIRSPAEANPHAELRLIVSHDNNVLQVFHLTARVGLGPSENDDEPATKVELDFSQGQYFRDIDAVAHRTLSITTNAGIDGTHRLFLKGNSPPATLPISESAGRKVIDRFRELLATTAADDSANETMLWELALLGSAIYGQLVNEINSRDLEEQLFALRDVCDEVVQVIRIGANFPYPWPVVYDWVLPDQPTSICTGECEHTASSGVYCLNGFWGARLIVEEFIKEKNIVVAPVITANAERPTCLVSVGREAKDKYSSRLLKDLVGSPGPLTAIEADAGSRLLDIMWDAGRRPGVLLVIGHSTRERAGAFDQPSIHTSTRDQLINTWVVQKALQSALARRWDDPKALVFLMACDSATSDLDQLTDTMGTFVTAGAGAVVGAEVKVNTSEVHDFITRVFGAFGRGCSLGEAMQEFRRARLMERRPDAFSFSAFGSAGARMRFEHVDGNRGSR